MRGGAVIGVSFAVNTGGAARVGRGACIGVGIDGGGGAAAACGGLWLRLRLAAAFGLIPFYVPPRAVFYFKVARFIIPARPKNRCGRLRFESEFGFKLRERHITDMPYGFSEMPSPNIAVWVWGYKAITALYFANGHFLAGKDIQDNVPCGYWIRMPVQFAPREP